MASFSDFCASYFQKYFDLYPTDAIYYGIDGYDHLLNDYSDETYGAAKSFLGASLSRIRQISPQELDQDESIDYALLEGRLTIQNYEQEKEDYRLKWPDLYLPTDAIYILTVRPTKDLTRSLHSRLERSPSLIQQGIANLSRREANPPRLWTEMAIEAAKGGISFLDSLPSHPRVQAAVRDIGALRTTIENTKSAVEAFAAFLERDLLPRSRGVYAVGEEHYNLLLKKKHFLHHDAQSLLALGESLFENTKKELAALAAELAPNQTIEDVARRIQDNHPSMDEVLSAYQRAMKAAREFVKETQLVSFPPEIAEVYFVSSIPFITRPIDLSIIAGFSILVSFVATILPSMRAARMNPIDALRHE